MEYENSKQTTEAVKVIPLRERATFFTRADNDLFRYLITKYKDILFENKTDNFTKRQKQSAWLAILDEFNMAAEEPRTLRKLKFKFHNTKTKARKSANDNVGKKPLITNSNDIKWMQSIMAVTMMDQSNKVDAEDFCIDNHQDEELGREQIEIVQYKPTDTKSDIIEVPVTNTNVTNRKHIEMDVEVDVKEAIIPEKDPLITARRVSSFGEVSINAVPKKAEAFKAPVKVATGINQLLKAVKPKGSTNYDKKLYKLQARHMQEQRDEDHQLFQLKKRKLLMEINLLMKSK